MMAQKHLHELLQEDQEPFVLKNYIADRRGQFKRPLPKTHIQVKKQKPISRTSNFPSNFCKNACFFSFHESPDPRKSPLFEFSSPAKSPCRNSNAIFLNIPARTAALLLDASLRIQKPKPQNKSNGLFGFFLKRLTNRNQNRKKEISGDGVKVSVKETVGRRKSFHENRKTTPAVKTASSEISAYEMGFSCSCNGSRPSSAVWSESNEEKSLDLDLDLDTSSGSQSDDFEDNGKFFCESPFHFVLQRSPSSGHQTPVFSSPATSPSRQKRQDCDVERLKKLEVEEEEEEEKEQCSPVSVLEPSFEDDYDGHVGNEDEDHDRDYDLECSYAIVQRAKQQLLQKLRRFEKLAELDPIELEKRMSQQDQDDSEYDANSACDQKEEDDYSEHGESVSSNKEMDIDTFVQEVLRSSFHHQRRIPECTKRLVSDLIAEEERKENCCIDREVVVKRVSKRLESWKEVESNTIDMMVGQDLRREVDGWKRNQEQVSEMALEIEYAIFGLLVDEFSEELVSLN